VNCMGNALAGLSGLGSAEIRLEPGPRRIAIQLGAEAVRVGRALGHAIEPLIGIDAQRIVDAAEGCGLADVEADLAAEATRRTGGRPSFLQDVMKRRELTRFHGHRDHIAAHRARMIGKIFFQEFRTIVHNDISADDRGSRGDEIGKVLWYVEAQKNKDREQ